MLKILINLFLLFSIISLVIQSRIITIIFLLLTYVISVIIALSLELDFIGVTILIVYMGAIAVFFLFIVMILGGKSTQPKISFEFVFNVIIITGSFLIVSPLFNNFGGNIIPDIETGKELSSLIPFSSNNLEELGLLLYTWFFFIFIAVGFVLLFAIVGVVGLNSVIKRRDRSLENTQDQLLRPYLKIENSERSPHNPREFPSGPNR
jgi:NADH-quinone oxidoreductase subunit J